MSPSYLTIDSPYRFHHSIGRHTPLQAPPVFEQSIPNVLLMKHSLDLQNNIKSSQVCGPQPCELCFFPPGVPADLKSAVKKGSTY